MGTRAMLLQIQRQGLRWLGLRWSGHRLIVDPTRLSRARSGGMAIEYTVIAAVVVIAIAASVREAGDLLQPFFETITTALQP